MEVLVLTQFEFYANLQLSKKYLSVITKTKYKLIIRKHIQTNMTRLNLCLTLQSLKQDNDIINLQKK